MHRIIRSRSKLVNVLANSQRYFNYQKNIYTTNLKVDESTLRNELNELNQFRIEQPNLYRFIKAYQQHGHKQANVNPLNTKSETTIAELNPANYGLTDSNSYSTQGLLFGSNSNMSLNEIELYLKKVYSDKMTIEFDHLLSEEEKHWISKEFEEMQAKQIDKETKIELAKLLLKSQTFDLFLGLKFSNFKRYSNEGSESSMAFYYSLFSHSAQSDIEQLVMGIAHRGRLNLITCLLNFDPRLLFTKIKGKSEFSEDVLDLATGDIAHHFPVSTDLKFNNKNIHINLMLNPSHLEAVDPLVLGKARSKQMHLKDCMYADQPSLQSKKVSSFLVHGDGAFAGQGIVSETFQAYQLPNYSVGGTVHLITNNQIGFTAPSNLGR